MFAPSSLHEIACSNQRAVLAQVIRSYRRTGQSHIARRILENARERGTYPYASRFARTWQMAVAV